MFFLNKLQIRNKITYFKLHAVVNEQNVGRPSGRVRL